MLETLQPSYTFAIAVVLLSIALLGYFSWKTLITANLFQKGMSLFQKEDYQGAEAAFRKVISMNSTNDMVHLLLGDTLMQQNKVEEATQEFQEVIQRAPKRIDAYIKLSNALMYLEKKEEAIANLQKAKDLCQAQRLPQKAEQIERFLQQYSQKNL
jgi:TolA-binding protein